MLEYVLTDEGSEIIRDDLCNRLRAGQVGIVPTETIYGLVCLANNEDGRRRIAEMKNRDNARNMQFLVNDLESCSWLDVSISETMRKLADAFWPGPMTLIVMNATGDYVGIRVPRNDFICNLIRELGQPLSSTGANPAGVLAEDLLRTGFSSLSGEPDFALLSGDAESMASTVIRLYDDGHYEILREGSIAAEAVKEVLTT